MKTAALYLAGLALIALACFAVPAVADSGSGAGSGSGSATKAKPAPAPAKPAPAKPAPAKPAPAKPAEPACSGPGMQRRCNGTCTNIQSDDKNCGSCGTVCKSGYHCDGHLFCRDASGNL